MNNWYGTERMTEERRKEITGLIENEQRLKAAFRNTVDHSGWSDRFLAWLGEHIEQAGHRLKEDHALEPCNC